jgi:hypothetical protein
MLPVLSILTLVVERQQAYVTLVIIALMMQLVT